MQLQTLKCTQLCDVRGTQIKMNNPAIKFARVTWGQYFLPIWSERTVSNMAPARSLTTVQSKTQPLESQSAFIQHSVHRLRFSGVWLICIVRFHSSYIVTWGEWPGKTKPLPVSQWKGKAKKHTMIMSFGHGFHIKKHLKANVLSLG